MLSKNLSIISLTVLYSLMGLQEPDEASAAKTVTQVLGENFADFKNAKQTLVKSSGDTVWVKIQNPNSDLDSEFAFLDKNKDKIGQDNEVLSGKIRFGTFDKKTFKDLTIEKEGSKYEGFLLIPDFVHTKTTEDGGTMFSARTEDVSTHNSFESATRYYAEKINNPKP